MSVIGAPMPASNGTAVYNDSNQTLYITVSGEAPPEAADIHLEVVNDNLTYKVVGMLGPILNPPPPRQSYTHQQHFETTVPHTHRGLPVTIETAGKPLVIRIRRLSSATTAHESPLPSPVSNQFSTTELMSATALKAIYYYNSRKLQLHAAGMKPYAVTDIKFNPVQGFAGGLMYTLEGQVPSIGILPVGKDIPYSITDEFDMQLPNPVVPSNTVIVQTQDGQRTLQIEYLGFPSTAPEADSAHAPAAQSTADNEVLMSAFSLSADYSYRTSMLTLKAEGMKPNNVTNVGFTRDSKVIGLKYLLQGFQSTVPAKFFEPYKVEQSFRVDTALNPPKDVVVETAGAKSNLVPIHYHWDGVHITGPLTPAKPQAQQAQTSVSQSAPATTTTTTSSGDIPLNVLYKVPFEIKWNCQVPTQGTVNINFDTKYLELQNASILSNQIIWTFNSVSTGNTKITVTERGGIAQYITGQTWDAKIFLPGIGGAAQPSPEEQALPSFTSLVTQGLNLIKGQYSDAQLLTAELATPNSSWHAGAPILTVTAEVVVNRQFKIATVMTKTPDPTKFGSVTITDPPKAMENIPIRWPINMDLVDAIRTLQKAGYHQGVLDTMLRQPISAVILSEPYYIFTLKDEMQVGVGVDSKNVKIFKNTLVVQNKPLTGVTHSMSVPPAISAH